MIVPDVNLILYAYDSKGPFHRESAEWWMRAVTLLEHDAGDIDVAFDLLESAGAGGNLTTDAQIGALALRYRATVHTADTDFVRLGNVPWRNPLTGGRG